MPFSDIETCSRIPGNLNMYAVTDTADSMHTDGGTYMVYTGDAALTVTGSVTGRRYRFRFRGDRQLVNYPDVSDMMAIQDLQKMH